MVLGEGRASSGFAQGAQLLDGFSRGQAGVSQGWCARSDLSGNGSAPVRAEPRPPRGGAPREPLIATVCLLRTQAEDPRAPLMQSQRYGMTAPAKHLLCLGRGLPWQYFTAMAA